MAKISIKVGYVKVEETGLGVHTPSVEERSYRADLIRNSTRHEAGKDSINDGITMNNRFSILASAYSLENFQYAKYIIYRKTKWKILSYEERFPRLILTIGGVYNG